MEKNRLSPYFTNLSSPDSTGPETNENKTPSYEAAYLLGSNMDVIKEFRNVFLEKYLEKNRLGRKSKLTAASVSSIGAAGCGSSSVSSRNSRRNLLRRRLSSIDKDSNETIKKVG